MENIETETFSNTDRLAGVIQMWFDKKTRPVKWSTIITTVELPPVNEPSLAESILQKCLSVKQNWVHVFISWYYIYFLNNTYIL